MCSTTQIVPPTAAGAPPKVFYQQIIAPQPLAQERCRQIQGAFSGFTDFHLSPTRTILKAVCELDMDQIPEQPTNLNASETVWNHYYVAGQPKGASELFYASRKGNVAEIIIPTWCIRTGNKGAWEAIQVTFQKDKTSHVAVKPVFRSTMPLSADKQAMTAYEIQVRVHCNQLANFPKLTHYGQTIVNVKSVEATTVQEVGAMTVEEFVAVNLPEFIASHPALLENEKWVVERLIDILEAISQLHQTGLVHADMKGENVLIDAGGQKARVTDVGLATGVNSVGTVRATPLDAAPEIIEAWVDQLKGEMQYTPQLDMWGFGILAYELLRKILKKPEVYTHKKSQHDVMDEQLIKKNFALAKKHYGKWDQDVNLFIASFKNDGHLLEAWLGSILKRQSVNRLSSIDALAQLKAYHATLRMPAPSLAEVTKLHVVSIPTSSSALLTQSVDLKAAQMFSWVLVEATSKGRTQVAVVPSQSGLWSTANKMFSYLRIWK